jgi:hypothetical protein
MAYDGTRPANNSSLVSADIRENFRALKDDGIVYAAGITKSISAGTGLSGGGQLNADRTISHAAHTGDVTGTTSLTIAAGAVTETKIGSGAVSQAKLKTDTGSVNVLIATGDTGYTPNLPGGAYGFTLQIKEENNGSIRFRGMGALSVGTSYVTPGAYFESKSGNSYAYAQQRYVTSSGEVHWVFILRDKTTKDTIAMYQAPDHPCFGNSGKPLLVSHPFGSYDPDKHEIIVINPSDEDVFNMQDACIMPEDKPDRDILEVIMENYEIDEDLQTEWPKKEVTVGLPKNVDWKRMPEGSKVVPVKKRIPQPEYLTTRKLWRKK